MYLVSSDKIPNKPNHGINSLTLGPVNWALYTRFDLFFIQSDELVGYCFSPKNSILIFGVKLKCMFCFVSHCQSSPNMIYAKILPTDSAEEA
jgi:hypothetical protein